MRHIDLSEFSFRISGYGRYEVTYTDPRGKQWKAITNDMQLIDDTKNADEPKQKDLHDQLRLCRRG